MLALIPRALIGLVALFAGLALFSPPEAFDSAVWGGGQRYIPWDCDGWTPIAAADRETGILETLAQNRGKTLYCGIDQSDTFSKAETWEVGEPRNERDDTVYWGDHGSFRGFTAPQEGWLTDGESGITGISIHRIFEFPREERRRRKKKPTPPPPPPLIYVNAQQWAYAQSTPDIIIPITAPDPEESGVEYKRSEEVSYDQEALNRDDPALAKARTALAGVAFEEQADAEQEVARILEPLFTPAAQWACQNKYAGSELAEVQFQPGAANHPVILQDGKYVFETGALDAHFYAICRVPA